MVTFCFNICMYLHVDEKLMDLLLLHLCSLFSCPFTAQFIVLGILLQFNRGLIYNPRIFSDACFCDPIKPVSLSSQFIEMFSANLQHACSGDSSLNNATTLTTYDFLILEVEMLFLQLTCSFPYGLALLASNTTNKLNLT